MYASAQRVVRAVLTCAQEASSVTLCGIIELHDCEAAQLSKSMWDRNMKNHAFKIVPPGDRMKSVKFVGNESLVQGGRGHCVLAAETSEEMNEWLQVIIRSSKSLKKVEVDSLLADKPESIVTRGRRATNALFSRLGNHDTASPPGSVVSPEAQPALPLFGVSLVDLASRDGRTVPIQLQKAIYHLINTGAHCAHACANVLVLIAQR